MPANYDYGNLLTAQFGRGAYMPQRTPVRSAFDAQNWAGLGAAAAAGRASDFAAAFNQAGTIAATGLRAAGDVNASGLSAFGGVAGNALQGQASVRQSEIAAKAAIDRARLERGSGWGGFVSGLAGLAFLG